MKRQYWTPDQLVLCRSDTGDGGWSLHAPWATDGQIASGEEPPLRTGPAEWHDDHWDRPDWLDREKAMNVLAARDKAQS